MNDAVGTIPPTDGSSALCMQSLLQGLLELALSSLPFSERMQRVLGILLKNLWPEPDATCGAMILLDDKLPFGEWKVVAKLGVREERERLTFTCRIDAGGCKCEKPGKEKNQLVWCYPLSNSHDAAGVLQVISAREPGNDQVFHEAIAIVRNTLVRMIEQERITQAVGIMGGLLADHSEKESAASRAKSAFLSNMSHEIRTPLNAIIGMTDLIMNTTLTREEEYSNLKIVQNASINLLNLINSILDLSKIEAGHLTIERIPFDLLGQVESVCESIAINAHRKGLNLYFHCLSELSQTVVGDPLRLKQVIINLINNAIKFTEQGEIVLRIEDMLLTDSQQPGLLFSVSDTGIGIPAGKQAMVFDHFTQVDTSTTRKYGGTGLGLAICKHLIELMGGEIGLHSELGRGTRFYFSLPLRRRVPLPEDEKIEMLSFGERRKREYREGSHPLRGVRLLLGDHHVTGRTIVRDILRRFGAEITEAHDDAGVLAQLSTGQSFDVMVLDEDMVKSLHDDARNSQSPMQFLSEKLPLGCIILISSHIALQQLPRPPWLQNVTTLKKPLRHFHLLKRIQQILGHIEKQSEQVSFSIVRRTDIEPMHVLLVEDIEENQQLAMAILGHAGHQVVTVGNGLQALQQLQERDFDAVLMDLQMPEMGGLEATERIRRGADGVRQSNIPIIIVTANALMDEWHRCTLAGANAFLLKPYRAAALLEMVEAHARKKVKKSKVTPLQTVEGIDAETLSSNKQLFVEGVALRMRDLAQAIEMRNVGTAVRSAKQLQDLAGSIGATRLKTQVVRLIGQVDMAEWKEVEEMYTSVKQYADRVLDALTEESQ